MKKIIYTTILIAAFLIFGIWYSKAFDSINNAELSSVSNEEVQEEAEADTSENEKIEENENNTQKSVDKNQISSQNNIYRININTASADELTSLPGIGQTKADAVVKFRSENGSFAAIEDIMKVSGIGEKTFEKIRELITV